MADPILDIPFDEPNGSTIAYDLGPGGHHAAVTAGDFIPGKFANCLHFPASGQAEIIEQVIDFSADFTFTVWAKADQVPGGPTRSWAVFKFPGVNNFINIELFTALRYWQNIAVTQEDNSIRVFVDGVQKGIFTKSVDMTGFCILNNNPSKTGGFCSLDAAKTYDVALTPETINEDISNVLQPVDFYFNQINTKDLGIIIEHIGGVLDMPDRKDPLTVDWEDYHGEVVDLIKPVYDVRLIELKCVIKATSQDDLMTKWLNLRQIFEAPGTVRLQIDAGTTPLLFDVYHRERLELNNKWRNSGPYFLRFDLKLREPQPVKRVLKVTGNSCSITLTSHKLLTISWGDGVVSNDVYGTGVTVTHTYPGSGVYYVVISGVIEDVTGFSTSAAILWARI